MPGTSKGLRAGDLGYLGDLHVHLKILLRLDISVRSVIPDRSVLVS
jgi:hypothetical protein